MRSPGKRTMEIPGKLIIFVPAFLALAARAYVDDASSLLEVL